MKGNRPTSGPPTGRTSRLPVEDVAEQRQQDGRHDEEERERARVAAQLGEHAAGGRERARGAHDASASARNASSRSVAPVRRGGRRRSGRQDGAVAHQDELSQRSASSITWLETRSVRLRRRARGTSSRGRGAVPGRGRRSARRARAPRVGRAARSRARRASARRRRGCGRPGPPAPRGRPRERLVDPRRRRPDDPGEVARFSARSGRRRRTAPASRSRRGGAGGGAGGQARTAGRSTICTPTIARISVVLPHPLGPSSPVTGPRPTSRIDAGRTS